VVSLNVSLDFSVKHVRDVAPKAIDFYCLIGLLPGGADTNDLDALWGDDWLSLAERLLRASLLVKKPQSSGENRFTLLPFMNSYAEKLMEASLKKDFHLRCCKYFAQVCKELLSMNANFELTSFKNLGEVMNRLVQFETNIWACIYRATDPKRGFAKIETSKKKYEIRPVSPIQRSGPWIESSQVEGDQNAFDENFNSLLFQRQEDGRRSMSQRHNISNPMVEDENIISLL